MRRTVITLAVVCGSLPLAADTPSGYQCAPGKVDKGVGCRCPGGYASKRGAENTAICAVVAVVPKPDKTRITLKPDPQGDDLVGARVNLDERPAGGFTTGALTLEVTPQDHFVEVFKDGFPTFSSKISVERGKTVSITVPFAKAPVLAVCPTGMVRVPAGKFGMGIDGGRDGPRHVVTLSTYCIDRTEVTVKAYDACVASRACTVAKRDPQRVAPAARSAYDQFCNTGRADRQNHPINCVDFGQAAAFCKWAGKRLPTEAEWEYAALGSDGRPQPWGNAPVSPRRLNGCGTECVSMVMRVVDPKANRNVSTVYDASDGWEATAPVGSYPDGVSPFGALDMMGNVEEIVADLYTPYTADAVQDPKVASSGSNRCDTSQGSCGPMARGASWISPRWDIYGAKRGSLGSPSSKTSWTGFRCGKGG